MTEEEKQLQIMDWERSISISDMLENTIEDMKSEKRKEIQRKIRWILDDLKVWHKRKDTLLKDIEKTEKAIEKAEAKIEQIKAGNKDVLGSINPDKPHGKEDKQQQ